MNYTKSGIIAVGAPHSPIRIKNEIENALENGLALLLLTDEGRSAARRFSRAEGCDWEEMPEEAKARLLGLPHAWKFFAGVAWGVAQ
tara:strand:- start:255 stop:515 length:261 start_codon:yes stop_codon:yes gene_type:complete